MKKSLKASICKSLTAILCAVSLLSGAMGPGSISAKAATVKTKTIDFRNGKSLTFNMYDTDGKTAPKDYCDALISAWIMLIYDPTFRDRLDGYTGNFSAQMSQKPFQGITYNENSKGDIRMRALNNSVGTGKYILSKSTVMSCPLCADEEEAIDFLMTIDSLMQGKGYHEGKIDPDYDVEFAIEIKYSDDPIITNNKLNATPSVSFEAGREIEDNGIRYRIMDTAGNLSAIGLTSEAKKVAIPDTVSVGGFNLKVTDIAQNFMKGNKKTKKVTIGANVTSIGKEAFYKCKKLKKVTVKSTNITSFGKKAFGKDAKGFTLKMPKSCKKAYKKLLKKAKIKF